MEKYPNLFSFNRTAKQELIKCYVDCTKADTAINHLSTRARTEIVSFSSSLAALDLITQTHQRIYFLRTFKAKGKAKAAPKKSTDRKAKKGKHVKEEEEQDDEEFEKSKKKRKRDKSRASESVERVAKKATKKKGKK